jgi:hypothetical protein
MSPEDLDEANERIGLAGQRRPDTKVLGHHVVGRIAARRGIFVRLLPSNPVGITAQVLVPTALLSDAAAPTGAKDITAEAPVPVSVSAGATAQAIELPSAATAPTPAQSTEPEPYPAPAPVAAQAFGSSAPAQGFGSPASGQGFGNPTSGQPMLPTPRPEAAPQSADAGQQSLPTVPGRRVRGAQLDAFTEPEVQDSPVQADPQTVRSQMSSLQSGVAAARNEFTPQPIPYTPVTVAEEGPPVPTRRVRGAQLAELGADIAQDGEVPLRDPAAIGRQLSGLQAATARARFENNQSATNDDTFGSNA